MRIKHKGPVSVSVGVAMVILTGFHFSFVDDLEHGRILHQPFVVELFFSYVVALGICGWTLALMLLLTVFSFLRRDPLFTKVALITCGVLVLSIPPLTLFKPFTPKRPFIETLHSRVSTNEYLDTFVTWSRRTLDQWNGNVEDQLLVEPGRLPVEAHLITWSGVSSNSVSLCLDPVSGEKVLGVWFSSPLPSGMAIGETNYVMSPESVHEMRKVRDGVYVFWSSVRD